MSDFIPYGRQIVEDDDVQAVVDVLRGDWLTTGPAVAAFEEEFAAAVDARFAVACSNGTAALHLSMLAARVGSGDEVVVPSLTFAASANCARYVGADVVFADVREDTLNLDPDAVRAVLTERTAAVVTVDYAGVPGDLDEIRAICEEHDLVMVEDGCHAPGARHRGRPVGSVADLTAFSFHPVKHLTTAEGGMITTDDPDLARRARRLRNHGIDTDFRQRESAGTWEYDVAELGFNYRLPDLNCALGRSQLAKLPAWVARRRELAARYGALLREVPGLRLPHEPDDVEASWHLYPVRVTGEDAARVRAEVFEALRADGIGVNVHYKPVHLHGYYRDLGYEPGLTPVAEAAYDGLLSLPMWPGLDDAGQDRVVATLTTALEAARA